MDKECFDGCQMGRGYGGTGEEVRGLSSTNCLFERHLKIKKTVVQIGSHRIATGM